MLLFVLINHELFKWYSTLQEEGEKKPKIVIVKENITVATAITDIVPPSKDMLKEMKKKWVYCRLFVLPLARLYWEFVSEGILLESINMVESRPTTKCTSIIK